MIYLALTLVLSVAINWPIWRMLTSEDRHARLRVPAVQTPDVPLLASLSNTGLV